MGIKTTTEINTAATKHTKAVLAVNYVDHGQPRQEVVQIETITYDADGNEVAPRESHGKITRRHDDVMDQSVILESGKTITYAELDEARGLFTNKWFNESQNS